MGGEDRIPLGPGKIGEGDSQRLQLKNPNCITAWHNRASSWHTRVIIDWPAYGRTLRSRLASNKDIWLHFKYIICRRLVVRNHCPSSTGSTRCRCCLAARETQEHLVRCSGLWEVWKVFRRLANATWMHNNISTELIYLGINSEGEIAPNGLLTLHRIMWKIVIIEMTKVEMEGTPFTNKHMWNMITRRYITRVRALHTTYVRARTAALMRQRAPPKPKSINQWMEPLACCDDKGTLTWHDAWIAHCRTLKITLFN